MITNNTNLLYFHPLTAIYVFGHEWRFFCAISCKNEKNVVPLQRETQRRDVCTSAEGFADILKRRLLALCSDGSKCRKFRKKNQDLATIDVLRDIDCPSCAYFGTSFAYMRMRTRVP